VLFSGSEFGDIFVYDQIDNNLNGNFRFLGTLPGNSEGWRTGVAFGNLNNDTLTDMMIGNYAGGSGLFYGKTDKIFGMDNEIRSRHSALLIAPNPARTEISISSESESLRKQADLHICGLDGKIIRQYSHVELPLLIDISGIKNGVYLLSLYTSNDLMITKLVICR
jgi:hypothetical protein